MAYDLEIEGEGEYTLELEREPEEYTLEVENEVVVAKGGDTPTPTSKALFSIDENQKLTGNFDYLYGSNLFVSGNNKVYNVWSFVLTSLRPISAETETTTCLSNYAFANCSLKTFIVRRTDELVSLSNVTVFEGTPIKSKTGYIYVPDELVDRYKAATNWVTYADQIKPLSELPTEA